MAMLTLAIDTAGSPCAAAIHRRSDDAMLSMFSEDIGRGHAGKLFPILERILAEAGVERSDIGRIGVTVGPGSFTGIRVGVAAARGLALALGIPAIGVTTLEAIAAGVEGTTQTLAVIDARRGQVYAQLFAAGCNARTEAEAMTPETAAALAVKHGAALAGTGAALVAMCDPALTVAASSHPNIAVIARVAALRQPPFMRPSPVYLRDADAKPQAGFAVARLEPAP